MNVSSSELNYQNLLRCCIESPQIAGRWSFKAMGRSKRLGNSNEDFMSRYMIFEEHTIYGLKAIFGDGHQHKVNYECPP
jgi:hypothetical protein